MIEIPTWLFWVFMANVLINLINVLLEITKGKK